MNKLTEIKEAIHVVENPDKYTIASFLINADKVNENYPKWLPYLISLLEEKDKALAFYADETNYKMDITVYPNDTGFSSKREKVLQDKGIIARKALNTSSNQEGES